MIYTYIPYGSRRTFLGSGTGVGKTHYNLECQVPSQTVFESKGI